MKNKLILISLMLISMMFYGCESSEKSKTELSEDTIDITTIESATEEVTTIETTIATEEVTTTEDTTTESTTIEEVTTETEYIEETTQPLEDGQVAYAEEKKFSNNGFNIMLNSQFEESSTEGATVCYACESAIVMSNKETFEQLSQIGLDSNSTLYDYANCVFQNNGQDFELYESPDGSYLCFNYQATVDDNNIYYFAVINKGSDAFWITNFGCLYEYAEQYQPIFESWADTITVD